VIDIQVAEFMQNSPLSLDFKEADKTVEYQTLIMTVNLYCLSNKLRNSSDISQPKSYTGKYMAKSSKVGL